MTYYVATITYEYEVVLECEEHEIMDKLDALGCTKDKAKWMKTCVINDKDEDVFDY